MKRFSWGMLFLAACIPVTMALLAAVSALANPGTTERVSVSSYGSGGNGPSSIAAISADGRFVVFSSLANDLAAGDANGDYDVFVRDRYAATTQRVSISSAGADGNGTSRGSGISEDGLFVAFSSNADNLVAGDTNAA